MSRHKWNGRGDLAPMGTSNRGGLAVSCIKCGCVREYVKGIATFFIDDSVYDKAPKCDERLLINKKQKEG